MYMRKANYNNTTSLHYTTCSHSPTTSNLLPKKLNFIKYVCVYKAYCGSGAGVGWGAKEASKGGFVDGKLQQMKQYTDCLC